MDGAFGPLAPLKGGNALHQLKLVDPSIFFFLMTDVLPNHLFVAPNCRDEVPPRPEVLTYEVALSLPVRSGYVDGAFTFDEPDHLRHRILGRYRNHHVHVVRHQMPLLDLALLTLSQSAHHFAQLLTELTENHLLAVLRYEHHVILTLPPTVA